MSITFRNMVNHNNRRRILVKKGGNMEFGQDQIINVITVVINAIFVVINFFKKKGGK